MQIPDHAKPILDFASIGAVVATLTAWLPPIAALVSIIWGCIRIYETRTVQRLLGNKETFVSDD